MPTKPKKILIVYATREGQTEKIAKAIATHLNSSHSETHLVNALEVEPLKGLSLDSFDFILCGGSMHAGGIEKELVHFIRENQTLIRTKPNAFFLVLLSAATKDPSLKAQWLNDAKKKMQEQLPFEFFQTEMIAGALVYSKYPWPLKWVMRRIAKQAGEDTDLSKDYEYTDWAQVKKFAESLVTRN